MTMETEGGTISVDSQMGKGATFRFTQQSNLEQLFRGYSADFLLPLPEVERAVEDGLAALRGRRPVV
jgi:hypothetical protein